MLTKAWLLGNLFNLPKFLPLTDLSLQYISFRTCDVLATNRGLCFGGVSEATALTVFVQSTAALEKSHYSVSIQ